MKNREKILNLIIIIFGLIFAYQVFSYAKTYLAEKESDKSYTEIKTSIRPQNPDENPGEIQEENQIDFENLAKINPDIFAWIRSDEGRIDYPLVKGVDNDKYLHTLASGDKNYLGAVFMDYRNESLDDALVLIYAHTTNNGTMFGSLNVFKENPEKTGFSFYTKDKTIKTNAVLAAIIPGDTAIDPQNYGDFEKRKEFFTYIRENAVYDTGYNLKEKDKIINLVTCTYEKYDSRLLVLTINEGE
ncbi:class B sortase [uncultured Anaerococcus sp.]|uniref:class B sortase n=1 Tax=uncultured Anaerococcus sp. TaxID=293428 RepID=UPI00288A95A1|nr:class B sortase [uncultured Anaerococcus sp.]